MTHDWFTSTASFNDRLADGISGFALQSFAPPQSVSGKRIEEHRRTSFKPDDCAESKTNQNVVETVKYFDFYWNRLLPYMLERQEDRIRGSRKINTHWDGYLVQLNKLELKKVMGVMEAAYKRQYISNASDAPTE